MNTLAVQMRLAEHHIILSDEQCTDGHYASVNPDFNYRQADIQLCPDFHCAGLEMQRQLIVHEYLHIHVKSALVPWESLEHVVSTDAWNITHATAEKMEENMISLLEKAIAPHMPLPPDVKEFVNKRRKHKV